MVLAPRAACSPASPLKVGATMSADHAASNTPQVPSDESETQSLSSYRAIFDHSMDAVLLTAPDGRIIMSNPATTSLFGFSEDELRQLGRQAIVDDTDPRLEAALQERLRTGRFRGELRF